MLPRIEACTTMYAAKRERSSPAADKRKYRYPPVMRRAQTARVPAPDHTGDHRGQMAISQQSSASTHHHVPPCVCFLGSPERPPSQVAKSHRHRHQSAGLPTQIRLAPCVYRQSTLPVGGSPESHFNTPSLFSTWSYSK